MASRSRTFGVLVVCTGNIARSALAQQLLRARFGSRSGLEFDSAGTFAADGEAMDPIARDISERLGGAGYDTHVAQS